MPDVPADEKTHSHMDLDHEDNRAVGKLTENHIRGDVAEVGSTTTPASAERETEGYSTLSGILIFLVLALVLIPIAVVIQSNKGAVKETSFYKYFDTWFNNLTGVHIL